VSKIYQWATPLTSRKGAKIHALCTLISELPLFRYFCDTVHFVFMLLLALIHAKMTEGDCELIQKLINACNGLFLVEFAVDAAGARYRSESRYTFGCIVGLNAIMAAEIVWTTIPGVSMRRLMNESQLWHLFEFLRFTRVAAFMATFRSIAVVFRLMAKSTQLVLYMIVLLLIFLLIWAVMGLQLFGSFYRELASGALDVPLNQPRATYATFFDACMTMFQLLTRQNWPSVMYGRIATRCTPAPQRSAANQPRAARARSQHCVPAGRHRYDSMLNGPVIGAVFHVSWVLFGGFILLSLLVSIVLDNYERDFYIIQLKQKQQKGSKVCPPSQ
jgi:hypothetical protein